MSKVKGQKHQKQRSSSPTMINSNDAAIVSEGYDDGDDSSVNSEENMKTRQEESSQNLFHCENMDNEDERWVYKFLRGGEGEEEEPKKNHPEINTNVNNAFKKAKTSLDGSSRKETTGRGKRNTQEDPITSQKPKARHSDAVLSCPYCFTTVCMDCQRHSKKKSRFRAMFVMNVGVEWERPLVYNEELDLLEDKKKEPFITATTCSVEKEGHTFYKVFCNNCRTEVASLDVDEEVYHFDGCCASST